MTLLIMTLLIMTLLIVTLLIMTLLLMTLLIITVNRNIYVMLHFLMLKVKIFFKCCHSVNPNQTYHMK